MQATDTNTATTETTQAASETAATASDTASLPSFSEGLDQTWGTLSGLVAGFFALLPKLLIAVVVFIAFIVLAWIVGRLVQRATTSHESANLSKVLGRLAKWTTILIGFLVSVAVVAPSVDFAKLLSTLGVGGVAIGFAFKDLLQNFMAGILILVRRPFEEGDQVVFEGAEGTVEQIDTRSTILRTYDNRRIIIPNGQVYTNAMTVMTAHDLRRSEYDVGIGYGDDIGEACKRVLQAMKEVDGVITDKEPEVLVWELAGSTVNLRARWWTDPRRSDVVNVRSEVMRAIKEALDDAMIDMPYPTSVVLLHDQTEATDGDRTKQREGWPAGENPPQSRAQWRYENFQEESSTNGDYEAANS
ncbi:MAG: mechanosensitive ion channel family protein [Pirellulaceae bacterium]|nr:mechanosensitive ion channel family protein [Pirellulaceae bacterium]